MHDSIELGAYHRTLLCDVRTPTRHARMLVDGVRWAVFVALAVVYTLVFLHIRSENAKTAVLQSDVASARQVCERCRRFMCHLISADSRADHRGHDGDWQSAVRGYQGRPGHQT